MRLTDEQIDGLQPGDAREARAALRLVAMTALQRNPLDPTLTAKQTDANGVQVYRIAPPDQPMAIRALEGRVGILELAVAVLAVEEDDTRAATTLLDDLTERLERCQAIPATDWPTGFAWSLPRLTRAAQRYVDLLHSRGFEPPRTWSPP